MVGTTTTAGTTAYYAVHDLMKIEIETTDNSIDFHATPTDKAQYVSEILMASAALYHIGMAMIEGQDRLEKMDALRDGTLEQQIAYAKEEAATLRNGMAKSDDPGMAQYGQTMADLFDYMAEDLEEELRTGKRPPVLPQPVRTTSGD